MKQVSKIELRPNLGGVDKPFLSAYMTECQGGDSVQETQDGVPIVETRYECEGTRLKREATTGSTSIVLRAITFKGFGYP